MAWWIYYFAVFLMVTGIRISSWWNPKSHQWIAGRKNQWRDLASFPKKTSTRIWFHVSSLGEFEQARPVMEKLKSRTPGLDLVLTFFSPSGYQLRSGYSNAHVLYLPADLPGHAAKWLDIIQPDIAVFVKYDVWPGYLKALLERNTPTLLISAFWEPGAGFRSWTLPPARKLLKQINRIFFQKPDHIDYFRQKGFHNIFFSGDTRMDRVLELPEEAIGKIPTVLTRSGPFDLIAGSTWPGDEDLLLPVISQMGLRAIIAPHDVSDDHIHHLMKAIPVQAVRLSTMTEPLAGPGIVVVDSIGLLAYLYALGKVAYIGGGFGAGIHNTLEPMAHGKPVVFGPRYNRFPEAVDMVQAGHAASFNTTGQLEMALRQYLLPEKGSIAGAGARAYLVKHAGASAAVVNYLEELIPFSPHGVNPSGN